MNYLNAHDELARDIANNARNFAISYLMKEQIAIYCHKALLKYASLQKFTPKLKQRKNNESNN